jgi:Rod binding domain-containing protein
MNVPPITSQGMAPATAALFAAQQSAVSASTVEADRLALSKATEGKASPAATRINDPEAVKKAASQFEAIILRQLLAPAIEPIMSGGLGGDSSSGNGVYGYMLTDTLADNLAKGGGMGLAKMLEKQLTPPPSSTDIIRSSSDLKHSTNIPSP